MMMSLLPLSICMSGIEITDDGVIARCDWNHSNETTDSVTHLCNSFTHLIHIGREERKLNQYDLKSLLPAEDVPAETDPPFHAIYAQSESPR